MQTPFGAVAYQKGQQSTTTTTHKHWTFQPSVPGVPPTSASAAWKLDALAGYGAPRLEGDDGEFIRNIAKSGRVTEAYKKLDGWFNSPEFLCSQRETRVTFRPDEWPCTMTINCDSDVDMLELDVSCTVTTAFVGSSKCPLGSKFSDLKHMKAQRKAKLLLKPQTAIGASSGDTPQLLPSEQQVS